MTFDKMLGDKLNLLKVRERKNERGWLNRGTRNEMQI
jgi:hypothetical protein